MNSQQPSANSGDDLPYLNENNGYLIFSLAFWNKIIAILRGVLATKEWTVTENGFLLNISSAAGSSTTSAFVITELGHQDYFVARQISNVRLDGGTGTAMGDVGSIDIKIAKVVNVRRTIFSQLLFGDTVTYTDDDPANIDNTRTANNGVDDPEVQVCLPPYITLGTLGFTDTVPMNAQCVVYAKKISGLTGVFDGETQLDWLEDAGHAGVRTFAKKSSP